MRGIGFIRTQHQLNDPRTAPKANVPIWVPLTMLVVMVGGFAWAASRPGTKTTRKTCIGPFCWRKDS